MKKRRFSEEQIIGILRQAERGEPAQAVIAVLARLFAERGAPAYLRSDNGPEFVAVAVKDWLKSCGVQTHYIDPGSPWQNADGESFNDKFRDECLNLEWFHSLAEARVIIQNYRHYYNEERQHSSLGYETPAKFHASWKGKQAGALPAAHRSLSPSKPPGGQEEGQSELPCPSVWPLVSALGSLSSVDLSSAPLTTLYHEGPNPGIMEPDPS